MHFMGKEIKLMLNMAHKSQISKCEVIYIILVAFSVKLLG